MSRKHKHKFFQTTYKGEDNPELKLYKGTPMMVIIPRDYVQRLPWVYNYETFLKQVRKIIHIYETKGTIYL
jgi:hypothetical protein